MALRATVVPLGGTHVRVFKVAMLYHAIILFRNSVANLVLLIQWATGRTVINFVGVKRR